MRKFLIALIILFWSTHVFGDHTSNHNIVVTWNEPGSFVTIGVEILTDSWASETYWDLIDQNGIYIDGIQAGTLVNFTLYNWEVEILPGEYTFNIYDTFGEMLSSDNPCHVSNMEIVNNTNAVESTELGSDDDYDPGF